MQQYLVRTSHRPRPLPSGRWQQNQRWNDLLYAHWPVPIPEIAALLPDGLQVDTFQGSAWLGAVPFWMERLKFRGMPEMLGARNFPELNLRTYVRDQRTGTPGIYFFSIDSGSLLAVAAARCFSRLPYYWAEMGLEQRTEREFAFYSRRLLSSRSVIFQARYRGLGPTRRLAEARPGTLEFFLMERYCLFTRNRAGQPVRANIHTIPWPLEEAEAEIDQNGLAAAIGIQLENREPVLHYSRRLAIYIWPAELVRPKILAQPVRVAVTPSG
jgi:uncharacterized protein YqjF (DUF2071 family)